MLCTQPCTSIIINCLVVSPFLQNARKKQRTCVLSTKNRTFCKLQNLKYEKYDCHFSENEMPYFTLSLLHAKNHLKSPVANI